MTGTGPQEPTTHVSEAQAPEYKDALLHFIETHGDLREVGRATDILRKFERCSALCTIWMQAAASLSACHRCHGPPGHTLALATERA